MKCGCRIDYPATALVPKIIFCPLHSAAEEMLVMLRAEHRQRGWCLPSGKCVMAELIRKAEGHLTPEQIQAAIKRGNEDRKVAESSVGPGRRMS